MELFDTNKYKTEIKNTCKDCTHKQRWQCNSKVFQYCGVEYLTEKQKQGEGNVSTFHVSECGLCNERKPVTHIRRYNWLKKYN